MLSLSRLRLQAQPGQLSATALNFILRSRHATYLITRWRRPLSEVHSVAGLVADGHQGDSLESVSAYEVKELRLRAVTTVPQGIRVTSGGAAGTAR